MRRRHFIMLLGGAAASWPVAARAQQPDQVRRIGVLMSVPENDPEAQVWLGAFSEGLQQLGTAKALGLNVPTSSAAQR
jgi:putative tryptophan/tyrosine transport system substrate-binding protein